MTIRKPSAGAKESAIDLTILGAVCAFGFSVARATIKEIPDGLESTGTALVMAIGGAVARYWRKKART